MREEGFTSAGGEFYVPSQGLFTHQGPHDEDFAMHTIFYWYNAFMPHQQVQ